MHWLSCPHKSTEGKKRKKNKNQKNNSVRRLMTEKSKREKGMEM